jgi:hypothetical protein
VKAAAAKTPAQFRNILFATIFFDVSAWTMPYDREIAKYNDMGFIDRHSRTAVLNPVTSPACPVLRVHY